MDRDFLSLEIENEKLREENKKLKQALRKCNQYQFFLVEKMCYVECAFCGALEYDHTDDCEYIILTKED